MRNLKRALSLALALVMVVSMMVVGAGAVSIDDFTDADEIVNTEAVTTMVSLGVIDGNDDGSYNPTGVVKRGEMAKLIAVMLNGGKDPTLGETPVVFADTAGHWAQNYISYVANLHIIDGRGDGTFGPNDDVTGAEAAKMILTALGYRSDLEGFTGANWAINVQAMANSIDLFDGLTINPDEGLSRDDTAQMLYNAVQSWMVEYRNLEGSYDGIVYPQPLNGTKANSTVLLEKFKVAKVEGVVAATSLIALDGHNTTVDGRTRLTDIEYNGELWGTTSGGTFRPTPVTYPIAIDSDLLGQRVVIYVKGLNDLAPNASGMEVVGTAIVSDDNTVVTTTGRLKDADAVKDALKGSGIAVDGTTAEGVTITWDDTTKGGGYDGITGSDSYPGMEQTFIDNDDDGVVDVILQKAPGLTKVNTYNENKETLNLSGIGTVDFEDILDPSAVAQGDYVLVYNYDDTYVLEAAESVSGTISAYVNNASTQHLSKITVDGTNYGWSQSENLAPDLLDRDDYPAARLEDLVDGAYTLYLDPHGNMVGLVEDEAAVGNYAVITGVNATGSKGFRSVEVKVLLSDGTTGKYDVNLVATAKNWSAATDVDGNSAKEEAMFNVFDTTDVVDTLVSYSIDGSTITLSRPDYSTKNYYESTSSQDSLELKNSKSRYVFDMGTTGTGDDVTVMADNRTVFFIRDVKNNYSVVTGLNSLRADALTTLKGSVIYYMTPGNDTRTARAIFAQVDEEYSSNSNYAFVSGDYTRTTEGTDNVYTYPVVMENGEASTLKSKTQDSIGKNEVHEYQVSGDYVTFDNDTSDIYNKLVVTGVGSNAVSVADAEDPSTRKDSFPTNGATIWNVEDTDNIYETDLQINDLVSLVLDRDGNVQTAYVYDRLEGDMATAAAMALTFNGGALGTANMDADGNYVLYNVAANQALTLPVALRNNDQTVTVKAKVVADEGTGTLGTDVSSTAGFKVDKGTLAGANIATIYTVGTPASEAGTTIQVTVTVAEDGYATRTLTYNVILWSGAQTLAAPTSVKLIETMNSSADIDSATEVTLDKDAETAVAVTYGDGANLLAFAVTPDAGTEVALALTKDGAEVALGAGNSFAITGNGTYALTVTVSQDGSPDIAYTYTFKVTGKSQSAAAPVYTITADEINPVTGEVTVVVPETQTDDQSAGLNDGTGANGMFTGFTANPGVKYTWVETRIPYTAAQYTAAKDNGGHAVWTYNPSYADCGYAASFPGNINDSVKASGSLTSEDGGYIRMYTLVSSTLVESADPTITFEIKFGANNQTFGQAAENQTPFTPDLVITLDVSGITFN